MKIEPRTLKGFRDFLPKEARKRQYVIETLKKVFESYGFEPLETPALEYEEILLGKYGDEGDKLMYRFEDNGQRRVALRYDQTVPLARVVAQYQNDLPFPFKRYQIQNVWRAENTQKGRFREFLQCDIDIIGMGDGFVGTDAEILAIVNNSLQKLCFTNYKILINDRKNFEGIDQSAVLIIDKLKKIGSEGVKQELRNKGFDENILETIINKEPTEGTQIILKNPDTTGGNIIYEPTLARGLDYYTGIIIEVEIDGFDAGSVGGGGRYDNLIGMFANQYFPAVGFSFGFDRLIEAMEEKGLFPTNLATTQVLVTVSFSELEHISYDISSRLRANNINVETYLNNQASLEKQFKYAEKKGIPYVVIPLNENEVELRTKSQAGEIVKRTIPTTSLPDEIK
jgi:histidyl-tRNA synthetase